MNEWSSSATFRPKKSLGQNFLVDENIARKIIASVAPNPEDVILEIGPGFGVLTKYLIPAVKKLIAVEIDPKLVQNLKERFGEAKNFDLIAGDFLELDFVELFENLEPLRVLGNIPYHITSPVIFKVFEHRNLVHDMILMIQKEVAQRIVAAPGNKEYGILSVFSQLRSEPRILFHVSRNVFKPKPEVDSTVVRWDFTREPRLEIRSEEILDKVIHGVFQQRRKMLRKSLKNIPELSVNLDDLNFDLQKRPEELTPAEFVELSNLLCTKILH
jgi:16S rRNA (adenine1518-N6/adenine1519-N6)-dimethyltransferase